SPIETAEQRANRAAQPLTRAVEVLNGSEQFDDDVISKPVDSVFPSFRCPPPLPESRKSGDISGFPVVTR
ncbi:hypothetical protein U1Q18_029111, partial [Sarracenia purpurea var. burkii]